MISLETIATKIGINSHYLLNLIRFSDRFYVSYYKKKSSGKERPIDSPNYEIRGIQGWILRNILENIPIHERAHGFIKGRGIKTNARYHLHNRFVMCLDIKDFFPSITFEQVVKIFEDFYEGDDIAYPLAKICTFQGRLPQGGVTSPAISNIVFNPLDTKITELCNPQNINYSRYADDMTFSSNNFDRLKNVQKDVDKFLNKEGFKLNYSKTRFFTGKGRKVVTGVILNSGNLTVGRKMKKRVRAALFNYFVKKDDAVNINNVLGSIAFIRDIEPNYKKKIINYRNNLTEKFGI